MLSYYIKRFFLKRKWRRNNSNNFTTYGQVYGSPEIKIGAYTYGEIYVTAPNDSNALIIGNYCSIAGEVRFILGADHPLNRISTYPFRHNIIHNGIDAISKGDIIIEDDVWIGQRAIIMSGIHIGQGAVIAAGAVVTKDVPPYAIVGGVPAKVIKYRFEPEKIEELLKVDYSKLTAKMVKEHIEELYTELSDVRQIGWMPLKYYKEDEK